ETIREFGRECLAASGEEEAIQQEHAQFFLALVEQTGEHLVDAPRQRWLARLERDYDNLRGALTWSLSAPDGGEMALRLVGSLGWFWYFRGYWSERERWAQAALARSDPTVRTAVRAKALQAAGLPAEAVAIWR